MANGDAHRCHMGTAIKHPVPDRVKPSFVIFDIRALLTLKAERQSAQMWQRVWQRVKGLTSADVRRDNQ